MSMLVLLLSIQPWAQLHPLDNFEKSKKVGKGPRKVYVRAEWGGFGMYLKMSMVLRTPTQRQGQGKLVASILNLSHNIMIFVINFLSNLSLLTPLVYSLKSTFKCAVALCIAIKPH